MRCSNKALASLSVSSSPLGPRFPVMSRLACLTATSARLFDLGWYAELIRCLTPHLVRKFSISMLHRVGCPSVDNSLAMPLETES